MASLGDPIAAALDAANFPQDLVPAFLDVTRFTAVEDFVAVPADTLILLLQEVGLQLTTAAAVATKLRELAAAEETEASLRFTLRSHNLLAAPYTKYNAKFHRNTGSKKRESVAQTRARYSLAAEAMLRSHADVVCLQECEPAFFDAATNEHAAALADVYEIFPCFGARKNRAGVVAFTQPGAALLLRRESAGGRLIQAGAPVYVRGDADTTTGKVVPTGGVSKSAVILPTKVVHADDDEDDDEEEEEDEPICICSAHFSWNPDERTALLSLIEEATAASQGLSSSSSFVLAGDFNAKLSDLPAMEASTPLRFLETSTMSRIDFGKGVMTGLSSDFSKQQCIDHVYASTSLVSRDAGAAVRVETEKPPESPYEVVGNGQQGGSEARVVGASDHVWIGVSFSRSSLSAKRAPPAATAAWCRTMPLLSRSASFAWLPDEARALRTLDDAMARFRRTNRIEEEYGGSGDESTVSKAEAAPASGRGAVRGRITRDGAVEPWHLQPKVKTAVELQRELKLAATAAATMTTHGKSVSDLARRLNIVVNLDDGEDDGVGSEAEIAGAAAGDSYETSTSISASKLRVIVGDLNLAPLARKLRMVGVDAQIAGESVRLDIVAGVRSARKGGGLGRVKISSDDIKRNLRLAAVDGRLIFAPCVADTAPRKRGNNGNGKLPGIAYTMMTSSLDVDGQFAEIMELFNLCHLVRDGGSRCGICNADTWRSCNVEEAKVLGVPAGVLAETHEFYLCETCKQLFWAGPKYEGAMDDLRKAVSGNKVTASMNATHEFS